MLNRIEKFPHIPTAAIQIADSASATFPMISATIPSAGSSSPCFKTTTTNNSKSSATATPGARFHDRSPERFHGPMARNYRQVRPGGRPNDSPAQHRYSRGPDRPHRPQSPARVCSQTRPGADQLSRLSRHDRADHDRLSPHQCAGRPSRVNRSFSFRSMLRLPTTNWCFAPLENLPDVGPLPASQGRPICFASFNRLAKLAPHTLDLWAATLPRSQICACSSKTVP